MFNDHLKNSHFNPNHPRKVKIFSSIDAITFTFLLLHQKIPFSFLKHYKSAEKYYYGMTAFHIVSAKQQQASNEAK
jgi:hypothetical protein